MTNNGREEQTGVEGEGDDREDGPQAHVARAEGKEPVHHGPGAVLGAMVGNTVFSLFASIPIATIL
jgi:hypothetical protein